MNEIMTPDDEPESETCECWQEPTEEEREEGICETCGKDLP